MITPPECRAARGWLDWTQADLASRAAVSLSTIRDFEGGRRKPMTNNLKAIQQTLEAAGIEFVEIGLGPCPGIIFNSGKMHSNLGVANKNDVSLKTSGGLT
jgi:predicted transcriptional regulator